MLNLRKIVYFVYKLSHHFIGVIFRYFIPNTWKQKCIKGEKVLITSAGSGIGCLLAYEFAKRGCVLILWDISETRLQKTVKDCLDLGAEVRYYKCDISSKENIFHVSNLVKRDVGEVNILVNNAGIVAGTDFVDASDLAIEATLRVNTMAHFWTLKNFLPAMLNSNHGHIVTIASMAGIIAVPGLVDYTASKFAIVGLDSALKMELYHSGKTGVHTTCVCPFYINTGKFDARKLSNNSTLSTEYVSSQIIEAVLINKEFLMLPRIMYLFSILNNLLPVQIMHYLHQEFGVIDALRTFKDRLKING